MSLQSLPKIKLKTIFGQLNCQPGWGAALVSQGSKAITSDVVKAGATSGVGTVFGSLVYSPIMGGYGYYLNMGGSGKMWVRD